MANAGRKIRAALKARQDAYTGAAPNPLVKEGTNRPGSQNRKKGYHA